MKDSPSNFSTMQAATRALKGRGFTNDQVADELKITKAMAHYYSRPTPAEKRCRQCCRPYNK